MTQHRYWRTQCGNKRAFKSTANWAGMRYPATTTPSRLKAKPLFLRAAVPAMGWDCASLVPPRWLSRDGAIHASWLITSPARLLEADRVIDPFWRKVSHLRLATQRECLLALRLGRRAVSADNLAQLRINLIAFRHRYEASARLFSTGLVAEDGKCTAGRSRLRGELL